MNLSSGRAKNIGIISIISVVGLSFFLFFYIQSITAAYIRTSLFEQQKQRQTQSTRSISEHIGSDLNLVLTMLDGLANSIFLQHGDLSSDQAKELLKEKYIQFNPIVNRLFVLDNNNIVTISLAPAGSQSWLGADFSIRDWVMETRSNLVPIFSDGFERQGQYIIYISFPIINRVTHQYLGTVGTSIPADLFFTRYGNLEHLGSQYLVAYDRNGTMLANGVNKSLIGENFFDDTTQNFTHHNKILNELTHNLLEGNPSYGIYDYGTGERLTTQYPVFVHNRPLYFIQIVQPTAQIYSEVSSQLYSEGVKMFILLIGIVCAVTILIVLFIKWNGILDNRVRRRTKELNESNRQLELANEQLKKNEIVQRDFINVAAHELRTPIQPILALTELVRSKIKDSQQNELLEVIIRNGRRLQKLTENILDATKIESQSLNLMKEQFNINDLAAAIVQDYRTQIEKSNLKLVYEPKEENIILIDADKNRLTQVFANLLNNAIVFTKEGVISVSIQKDDSQVVVSIKDAGSGIDPEIFPRLFSRFASKSFSGTGLGLFISKSIVEAHGGRIWAKNNADYNGGLEKGATFYFSLPLIKSKAISKHSL
jgi:signal transduction histidine kinase